MKDRETWDLRGPVRTCQSERIFYTRQCGTESCQVEERRHSTTLEFRASGGLSKQQHENPDGSVWTTTFDYDAAGRLVAALSGSGGEIASRQRYEYDEAGRLVWVFTRKSDNDERLAEAYRYDASGSKKKVVYLDTALQSANYHSKVEGTDTFYAARGAETVRTLYNGDGKPTDLIFETQANGQVSRVEFRYNGAGQLVAEVQTNSENVLPRDLLSSFNPAQLQTLGAFFGVGQASQRRSYAYDRQGRRIESRIQMGAFALCKETFGYNEHGDLVSTVSHHEERDYDIDHEGKLSDSPTHESMGGYETRFRYEYDSHGNWISKTTEGRTKPEAEWAVSCVERRTIAYFS